MIQSFGSNYHLSLALNVQLRKYAVCECASSKCARKFSTTVGGKESDVRHEMVGKLKKNYGAEYSLSDSHRDCKMMTINFAHGLEISRSGSFNAVSGCWRFQCSVIYGSDFRVSLLPCVIMTRYLHVSNIAI